jgi:predicted nucleic acid-binding protein
LIAAQMLEHGDAEIHSYDRGFQKLKDIMRLDP